MRALTFWQPWAWAIAAGHKRVENRPWKPPEWMIGNRLALHAGKTYDKAAEVEICKLLGVDSLPLGAAHVGSAIVAVVTVVEYCDVTRRHLAEEFPEWKDQTAWSFGPYVWLLRDVVSIEPVHCRGAQGLWKMPDDVEAAVVQRDQAATEAM